MLTRTMLAAVLVAAGVTAVVAQQDPIKARKDLMKANGDQGKIAAAMAKGEMPFDLAKAKVVFATFADAAEKMPNLFPPDSKKGGDTAALPKVWESMDDFKAKFAKLAKDAKEAEASVKDLDSFKVSLGAIGKECGGCHETYRQKKT